MPPTLALLFAPNDAKIRWREPYVSEGLNRKFAGVIPRGIYRGFGLVPNGAALTIDIVADASGANLAVYETGTAYQLSLRKNATFSISLAAFANTTVYLALYATYVTTTDTVAELRVYSVADYNAAVEKPELVVLGTVAVPIAGVIPASAISFSARTLPWKNTPVGALPWQQIVRNGGFEEGAGTVVPGTGFQPIPGFSGEVVGSATCQVLNTDPRTGALSLWMGTAALASFSRLGPGSFDSTQPLSAGGTPVLAGQLVDVSFWVKCLAVVPYSAGTSGLRLILRFYDNADALISTFTVATDPAVQVGTTAQYDQLTGIFAAPVDGYFTWYFAADIDLTTGVGVFKIDDVQISVEPPVVFSEVSGADLVTLPTVRGTQLDIVPANSVSRLAQNNAAARLDAVTSGSDTVLSLSTAGDKSTAEVPRWDTPYAFKKLNQDFAKTALGIAGTYDAADQDGTPHAYKLLHAYRADSVADVYVRVYSQPFNIGLVFTVNARWGGGTDQFWYADTIFDNALKFVMGLSGPLWQSRTPAIASWSDAAWTGTLAAGTGLSLLRFVSSLFTGVAPNGFGVSGTGVGFGTGVVGLGGPTAPGTGVTGTGGTAGGTGVLGTGTVGFAGVNGTGGPTNGIGVNGNGTGNAEGVYGNGAGTGSGVRGVGGGTITAVGVFGTGSVAGGVGVFGQGTTTASGVFGIGGPTAGADGVTGTGGVGGGSGVVGVGILTGEGVKGTGGVTDGHGGVFTGTGNGRGVSALASGTGAAVYAEHSGSGGGVVGVTTGSATAVAGQASAGTGYGGVFTGNATKAALRLTTQADLVLGDEGAMYISTGDDKLRFYAGGAWHIVTSV